MAVCIPAKSGVVDTQMQKSVALRRLDETKETTPSLLTQLGMAQWFANGFIGIDNQAARFPALRGFVEQLHIGEKIRSLYSHNHNETLREVGNLPDADSRNIMKVVEAGDAGMKITQNQDGSATVTATEDLVGLKKGETYTLPPKLNATLNKSREILNTLYTDIIKSVKASLGHDPDATNLPTKDQAVIDLLEESRRANYFPHVRTGRYAIEYKVNGKKHLEGYGLSLQGKKLKTSWQQVQSRAEALKSEGATDIKIRDFQAEREMYEAYLPDVDSISAIDALFQTIMVPNKKDAYAETKKVLDRLRAEAEHGRQQRLRRRANVPGWLRPDNFDTYFRSTLPAYAFSISDYIANKTTEAGRRAAINSIPDKAVRDMAEEAERYLHSDESQVARLKNFTYLYTIGGNLSSAMVQPTQLLHTTWPLLSAVGGTGRAAKEIMSVANTLLKSLTLTFDPSKVLDISKMNLPEDEKQIIQRMFQEGLAEALLTRDQAPAYLARSQDSSLYSLGKNVGKVMDALSFAFATAETLNRVVTGVATYRMTKDARSFGRMKDMAKGVGTDIQSPFDAVEWAVRETQFTMGKPFRAKFMRGMVGGLAFQFAPFAFKMLGFQRRAAEYYGGKGILSAGPGRKVFALHMLGLFATAGLWGLPFAAPLGDLLDKLLKEAGPAVGLTPVALKAELRQTLQDLFAEIPGLNMVGTPAELADYFFSGPFRATGIDISKRTALDIVPENLLTMDLLNMGPFMSAVVGGVEDAVTYNKKGLELMALASLMPVFVRNAARAYTMQDVGFITPGKIEPTLPARDLQEGRDILAVGIGFTPTKVARAREAKQEMKDLGTKMDSLRRSYTDSIAYEMASFYQTKDPSHRAEAIRLRKEAMEFDQGKPLVDRIIQDADAFNTNVETKVKQILYPQRPEAVPKVVRGPYAERLQN